MPAVLALAVAYRGLFCGIVMKIIPVGSAAAHDLPREKFSALRALSAKNFPENAETDTGGKKQNKQKGITTHRKPPRSDISSSTIYIR
jgi:hypothetical protein